jgi:hypothetical protein
LRPGRLPSFRGRQLACRFLFEGGVGLPKTLHFERADIVSWAHAWHGISTCPYSMGHGI